MAFKWKETGQSRMLRKQESRELGEERGAGLNADGLPVDGTPIAVLGGRLVLARLSLDDGVLVVDGDYVYANDITMCELFAPTNVNDFSHAESMAGQPGVHVLPRPRLIPRDQVGLHWRKAQDLLVNPGGRARFAQAATDLLAEQARLEQLLRETRAALDLAVEVHGSARLKRMISRAESAGTEYDQEFLQEEVEVEQMLSER